MPDYLGLTAWPFAAVPNPERAKFWAGRPDVRSRVHRLLRSWTIRPDSEITIYYADWGQGKTYTLYYLMNKLKNDGANLVHYIQLPAMSGPGSPFKLLFERIMFDFPLNTLTDRVYAKFKDNPRRLFDTGTGSAYRRMIFQLLWILRTNAPGAGAVNRWLRGQRVTQAETKDLRFADKLVQVPPSPKTSQECQTLFSELIDIAINFPDEGSSKCILLIDEFQRIQSLGNKKMMEVCDSLHTFYNSNPNGLKLVLAFAIGDSDGLTYAITGDLMSRVSQKINLPNLGPEDVPVYLKELLANHHPTDRDCQDYYPFEANAAKMLCDYTYKVVGDGCTLRKINIVIGECLTDILIEREDSDSEKTEDITLIGTHEVSRSIGQVDQRIKALLGSDSEEGR